MSSQKTDSQTRQKSPNGHQPFSIHNLHASVLYFRDMTAASSKRGVDDCVDTAVLGVCRFVRASCPLVSAAAGCEMGNSRDGTWEVSG